MLALIDKKLSRQEAYKMVQRNAMKAWNGNRSFLTLLKHDAEVMKVISAKEWKRFLIINTIWPCQ
jgi:adenylosuccinate lyase